jgi:hypothetical protein
LREVHESRGYLLVLRPVLSSPVWTESRLDQQLSAGDWVASEMLSSGALDFAAKLCAKHCSFMIPRVTCLQISRSVMCRGNDRSNGAERTCNTVNSSLTRIIRCRYPSDVVPFINLNSLNDPALRAAGKLLGRVMRLQQEASKVSSKPHSITTDGLRDPEDS